MSIEQISLKREKIQEFYQLMDEMISVCLEKAGDYNQSLECLKDETICEFYWYVKIESSFENFSLYLIKDNINCSNLEIKAIKGFTSKCISSL